MAEEKAIRERIEAARRGDGRAFGALAAAYRDRVRDCIALKLHPGAGRPLDAEEVLQDTFALAFASLDRFAWQGEDSFYSWLCGIARNVIRMHRKRANHSPRPASLEGVLGGGVTPSRALRRKERLSRLEEALSKLNPAYREALYLSRMEGLKIREIAHRMNRTEDAVGHLLTRGTLELRRLFGETESLHLPDPDPGMEGADDDGAR